MTINGMMAELSQNFIDPLAAPRAAPPAASRQQAATERGRFFMLLESHVFRDDNLTHQQVFGHLAADVFTAQEAAEYLEMSVANFRRYVRRGQITPVQTLGRNQMFATRQLKAFKRAITAPAPESRLKPVIDK